MVAEIPEKLQWNQWIDLYRVAVEEYRFEVRLNADRTQHFLLLNGVIIGVGIALTELPDESTSAVAAVFLIGVATSMLGLGVVMKTHSYYRMASYKKMLLEDLMGLHQRVDGYSSDRATLAIGTTQSMQRAREVLNNPDSWLTKRIPRFGTVMFWTALAFLLFAILNLIGLFVAIIS